MLREKSSASEIEPWELHIIREWVKEEELAKATKMEQSVCEAGGWVG